MSTTLALAWTWMLLPAGSLLASLALLLKGLYPKPIGTAPHCPHCGYNLTGSQSPICPECGTSRRQSVCSRCGINFDEADTDVCTNCGAPRVMDTSTRGEYRRSKGLLVTAVLLAVLGLASGTALYHAMPPAARPARVSTVSNNVQNARMILANLRQDCAAGRLSPPATTNPLPDSRLAILDILIKDKIRLVINKRIPVAAVSKTALAQAGTAGTFLTTQLMPAYEKARQSNNPADIKAIIPLLVQLDTQLAALATTVKGY